MRATAAEVTLNGGLVGPSFRFQVEELNIVSCQAGGGFKLFFGMG